MNLISKTYWGGMPFHFHRAPVGAQVEPRRLRTADFREVRVQYWTPPGQPRPATAVVCMHPRVDFTRHYTFPRLLEAGIGCLGAASRTAGDDTDCVHEDLLLDVGACVRWLQQNRSVRRVVLLGNSGGGSLMAYYQAQATRAPADRVTHTPGGRPTGLATGPLPEADGLVLLAAHRGQGQVLLGCIDPSVIVESDPLSCDRDLDMYDPANGFRVPPEPSHYSDDFVARYRSAQRDRVARIDALARAWLAQQRQAGTDLAHARDPDRQRALQRTQHAQRVMVVYRTMANLHYVDPHLDPSPRELGSLLSDRPDLMNYRRLGFARTVTPDAWLSTWSGLSSRADLCANLPEIRCPVLMIHAARDREILPNTDVAPLRAALRAEDQTALTLDARHYFESDPGSRERPDTDALMDVVTPWLRERFA